MGGVAGIFNVSGEDKPLAANLYAMARNMRRRGPDDEGYLVSGGDGLCPLSGADTPPSAGLEPPCLGKSTIKERHDIKGSLFLASRRLAIVGSGIRAHQPMCTEDRRFWLVYNGEIYNHSGVRARLEQEGEKFLSSSDAEVALLAYRRWGHACLDMFNGFFSFAIWDEQEKTLFCARDRLGIKPFYYAFRDGTFVFASQIRTLLASGLVPAEPDMLGIYYGMSFGMTPRPMTSFKGISALRQGHWLKIGRGGEPMIRRYWRIPTGQADMSMSPELAMEALDSKLKRAVSMRLASDVPFATFLSGGLDSTLISTIAAESRQGVKAFTLLEHGMRRDQGENAKLAASAKKMEHVVKTITEEDILSSIDDIFRTDEEPFCALDPNYFISRFIAANKVKVVLSGLGADELFCGYMTESRYELFKLVRALKCAIPPIHYPYPFARLNCLASASSPEEIPLARRCFITDQEKASLFTDPAMKGLNTIDMVRELYVEPGTQFSDPFEAISYIDMMSLLANHHLHRADNWTMRFSVEARHPFLDHELVELAFRIPSKYKIRDGQTKWILRQLASRYIPQRCVSMIKPGMRLPNSALMKGPLLHLVYESLKKLAAREIFNEDKIISMFIEWKMGLRPHQGIWQLVATEMWMAKRFDGRQPESSIRNP